MSSLGAGAGKESAYADAVPNGSVEDGVDAPDMTGELGRGEIQRSPKLVMNAAQCRDWPPPHVIVRQLHWAGRWSAGWVPAGSGRGRTWVRARAVRMGATLRKLRRQGRALTQAHPPRFQDIRSASRRFVGIAQLAALSATAISLNGTASEYLPTSPLLSRPVGVLLAYVRASERALWQRGGTRNDDLLFLSPSYRP